MGRVVGRISVRESGDDITQGYFYCQRYRLRIFCMHSASYSAHNGSPQQHVRQVYLRSVVVDKQ